VQQTIIIKTTTTTHSFAAATTYTTAHILWTVPPPNFWVNHSDAEDEDSRFLQNGPTYMLSQPKTTTIWTQNIQLWKPENVLKNTASWSI
jgi:hypothetical protein